MQCPHCFREKDTDGACPYCGYDPALTAGEYPQALKPGSVLNGRYILGHVLGQGGFGITYLAWDDSMKERVAIKEYFPAELAGRSGVSVQVHSGDQAESFAYGKAQFLEEAKTLASFIGCPGIVRIDSYFEENGTAYMSMEYVDGLPLNKYMAEHGGRLTSAEANRLLLPLMESLEAVHAKGVVHRDIAPDNILVTKDGTAKLIDFGAARYSKWTDIVAVGAGSAHTVALKADGTVLAVGNNQYGQNSVSDWTDVVAVAAGAEHTAVLKADGTVIAVGRNDWGQCNVSEWTDIIAISAGRHHTVGVKEDGTVIAAGAYRNGTCDFSKMTDIVAVAAGQFHTIGLRGDGKVIGVRYTGIHWAHYGEDNVSDWSDIVSVAAGSSHSVGLHADGTVVAVGDKSQGELNVKTWNSVVAVAAGYSHTVGLKADGSVCAVGYNEFGQCDVSDWQNIAPAK